MESSHKFLRVILDQELSTETIAITQHPLEWECPVSVTIDGLVEEAERREMNNKAEVKIYTDRSGHGGRIGAVAVLYRRFRQGVKVLRKCLGSDKEHTVFKGECMGQMLEMKLLRREVREKGRIADALMGTNNQAGMQALQATGEETARYLVDEVLKGIQKVKKIDEHMKIKVY
ncbi:hypothetical protein J132_03937 [Termitomyces sp. J132]|nr:hypothetical protein J132_03937 [Termitomyces sp. J132]